MRAVVVIPTYNERENLPQIVDQLFKHVPEIHILVVDDNSPDGTGHIADELSDRHRGKLFVLHRVAKEGLGRAYVAGFKQALAMGYDYVLQMDADLSHDPAYLPAFLSGIGEADLVLGSRYLRGISVVNWDFKRLLLSKMATRYVRFITGMKFSDATGGFKCWRRQTLQGIDLERIFSNGYLFQIETTYKALHQGFKISEIQIVFTERRSGRSKIDWRIIAEALIGVLKLRWSRIPSAPVEDIPPQLNVETWG